MQADLGQFAQVGHGYFTFPKLEGEIAPWMTFRGKKVLTWSLNNYLGLCNHPEIREVDAQAAKDWGLGYPMGSRMLTGNTDVHERFEREVSEFMGKEDAYLLNFGYQGIVSIVSALVDRRDVIVYDQLAHACIMDGMMMTPAKRFMYRHNDMEQFEDRLKKARRIVEKTGGGILVITEGVFGMKGDLGQLDEIVKFKEEYNFRLLVDDAHGFGVMGEKGIGTGEHLGVQDQIDVLFCTFAKSMASIGAFVCGDKRVIHYLRYNMRSQIYAKSLPMPLAVGALKRLEMLKNAPAMRKQLWDVVNTLQNGLRERHRRCPNGSLNNAPKNQSLEAVGDAAHQSGKRKSTTTNTHNRLATEAGDKPPGCRRRDSNRQNIEGDDPRDLIRGRRQCALDLRQNRRYNQYGREVQRECQNAEK